MDTNPAPPLRQMTTNPAPRPAKKNQNQIRVF